MRIATAAMTQFRVFLSAVSSEFESARDALANDLQSFDDVIVKVQRSFRHDHTAGTLLHKLRNYIEYCDAVICLVGSRSGAGFPTAVEASPFLGDLPPGVTEASYTQWEFFFARRFGRQMQVYFAKDTFRRSRRNPAAGDRPELQAAFVAHIESLGLQRTLVGDRHEFRATCGTSHCPAHWQRPSTRNFQQKPPSRSSCPIRPSARCSKAATTSWTACAPA
jgi:hypothetical protein